jgi:hypothetical protein
MTQVTFGKTPFFESLQNHVVRLLQSRYGEQFRHTLACRYFGLQRQPCIMPTSNAKEGIIWLPSPYPVYLY